MYLYLLTSVEIVFAAQTILGGFSRPSTELPYTLTHFTYRYMDHTDSPERLRLKTRPSDCHPHAQSCAGPPGTARTRDTRGYMSAASCARSSRRSSAMTLRAGSLPASGLRLESRARGSEGRARHSGNLSCSRITPATRRHGLPQHEIRKHTSGAAAAAAASSIRAACVVLEMVEMPGAPSACDG